jgi:hypothetical protein
VTKALTNAAHSIGWEVKAEGLTSQPIEQSVDEIREA